MLLAGALDPAPPPLADLVEPDLLPEVPADVESLLALLPQADLYLQDEVHFALHPTLTRRLEPQGPARPAAGRGAGPEREGLRLRAGRLARRLVRRAVGARADGGGLLRAGPGGGGALAGARPGGDRRVRQPAHAHGGRLDAVRQLLAELAGDLQVVYTPAYDPDANRIEWLWRVSRRAVTHNHQRRDFATLCADAEAHFRDLADHPDAVLAHIGSPGFLAAG